MTLYKRCRCSESCTHSWWYRFECNGREFRASTRTANRTLADQIGARQKVEVLTGQQVPVAGRSGRLSRHVQEYTEWTQVRNRTGGKDPAVLARFVATVGDKRLDQVATFDVERWKTIRAKQVRKSTVNRELNIVRGCFSRAVEWKRLVKSPMATVKPFRVENTRLRVLSPDEIRVVLTEAPQELALIARVTLEGLLRVSEVLSLMRSDIQRDYLVVTHTKNSKMRKVPISSDLRRALLARTHQSGYVFGETRYQGHPPTQSTVTQAFRRVMARWALQTRFTTRCVTRALRRCWRMASQCGWCRRSVDGGRCGCSSATRIPAMQRRGVRWRVPRG